MTLGGLTRPELHSASSLKMLNLRIQEINTDVSLSSDEKARAVNELTSLRNKEFLRGTNATPGDGQEPPVKRQVKRSHANFGDGCGSASCGGEEERKDYSDVHCESCSKRLREGRTHVDKCRGCRSAVEIAKCEDFLDHVRSFEGRFPGKNAKPCPHYKRHCWLLAKCCNRYYPCRRCHDQVEDHAINRHETEFVGCSRCGSEKEPAEGRCGNCGVGFADYFCRPCRFYDDDRTKPVYHCEHCGICRMGKGLGKDQHHCHRCKTCVPIDVADNHPCMDSSVQRDCPVCLVYMATSTDQVLFMRCGHAIHAECFEKYTKVKYNCPICCKALTDMSAWYKALDATLAQEETLPRYKNRYAKILCHDCELKSVAKFHFKFHKCFQCKGYNTRVLSHFDLSDADARERDKYDAADMALKAAQMASPDAVEFVATDRAVHSVENEATKGDTEQPCGSCTRQDSCSVSGEGEDSSEGSMYDDSDDSDIGVSDETR